MNENRPVPGEGYWYLAGPYSDDPDTRYAQHMDAASFLTRGGLTIYSPILHYHNLALTYSLSKEATFWEEHNLNMIAPSNGIILLQIYRWRESQGVKKELLLSRLKALPVWGLIPPDNLTFTWQRLF